MSFGFASKKVPVSAQCENGHATTVSVTKTIPAKFIDDIPVKEGTLLGQCTVCGKDAKSIGQVIRVSKGGKITVINTADIIAEEKKLINELHHGNGSWQIRFTAYQPASASYNTEQEYMNGKVTFRIWKRSDIMRHQSRNASCVVRQASTDGPSFELDPIEVDTPEALKLKVNYQQFRDAVEEYIRTQFGANGIGIRVAPGVEMSMSNVSISMGSKIYTVDAIENTRAGW